jgi:RNA polymerase sigma-70 factor (family 1)
MEKLKTLSDADLLNLLKDDNELAFRELYERYWHTMYSLACRKLRQKEVAEELAQELFLMLWRKRHTLKIINLKAFLSVSLKNLIIDYVRRHIQEEHYLDALQQFFPIGVMATTEAVYFNELTEALHTALTQLPEKTREVFMLNRFEHLTIREIALKLNLSEKAIEYHLSRSTTFLKHNLRDFSPVLVAISLFF